MNTPGIIQEIFVVGNYAYVAGFGVGRTAIDVSNQLNPLIAGSVNIPSIVEGLFVTNGYVYVANITDKLKHTCKKQNNINKRPGNQNHTVDRYVLITTKYHYHAFLKDFTWKAA